MSTTSAKPRAAAALINHLREPMRRSAYALIAGTGVTSLLGLLFWALAAHWLSPATVGIGAALVSALTLLANISTLGLRNGLVRFLPEAGPATRRLVASSYAVCAAAAMVVAGRFLFGQPWWADELGFLRSSPFAAAAFVAAAAVWVRRRVPGRRSAPHRVRELRPMLTRGASAMDALFGGAGGRRKVSN